MLVQNSYSTLHRQNKHDESKRWNDFTEKQFEMYFKNLNFFVWGYTSLAVTYYVAKMCVLFCTKGS